jgi:hypothetical protein
MNESRQVCHRLKRMIKALAWMAMVLVLALAACGGQALGRQQAQDAGWRALEPNTSSHDRANWQVVEVRQVRGQEVAYEFAGEPVSGCWSGPTPVPNGEIQPGDDYWYVAMSPRAATPLPAPTLSPTAPPFVPEPFMYKALFLLDGDGQVVARKLYCVIY